MTTKETVIYNYIADKDPRWLFVLDTESRQLLKHENPLILDFGDRQKTLVESYDEWFENNSFKHVLQHT